MTLLDRIVPETLPERRIPVSRRPSGSSCARRASTTHQAIATLINDRRIAENLSRVAASLCAHGCRGLHRVGEPQGRARSRSWSRCATARSSAVAGWVLLAGADPEIGYWYGVPFWGRGYATEAARALIDYAFNDLGHETLEGGARVTNPASRCVLEKCGYVWTGVIADARACARRRVGAGRPLPPRSRAVAGAGDGAQGR